MMLAAAAGAAEPSSTPGLFSGLAANTADSFAGWRLALPVAAAGATAVLVTTGSDFRIEHYFHTHAAWNGAASPVTILASFGTLAFGGVLYVGGRSTDDREMLLGGCAVLQSLLITLGYASLLKAVTGRPHPDPEHHADMNAQSRSFRWGFLRGGVFWGWPSGHVASMTTTVAALCAVYPDKPWLPWVSYPLVAYAMFGVSAHGRGTMHWASDALAGALIGWAVGDTTGRSFRRSLGHRAALDPDVSPHVMLAPSGAPCLVARLAF